MNLALIQTFKLPETVKVLLNRTKDDFIQLKYVLYITVAESPSKNLSLTISTGVQD